MSIELSNSFPHSQPFEAQEELQGVTALPQVEEAAEDDVPPNGGLTAWLQVLGGFLVIFNAQ